jgi:hypothetical protein
MKLRIVMRWFLALGIALGVVTGPAAPLMAAMPSAPMTTMTAPMADENAMQMADGMPCCPKKQDSVRFDCDKCAFSSCMMKLSAPAHSSAVVKIPVFVSRIAPVSEFVPAGLAKSPPERPPRTNV